MINNTNNNIGFNGLTRRVGAGAESASAANTGRLSNANAFSNDGFVRTGAAAPASGSAAAAGTAAMDRLAAAYDADPAKFARNLAEQALNDVVSLVG